MPECLDCYRIGTGVSAAPMRSQGRRRARGLLALAAAAAAAVVSREVFAVPRLVPAASRHAAGDHLARAAATARGATAEGVDGSPLSPTSSDLLSAISGGGLVVAEIHKPNCRACRRMADEFRKVAERMSDRTTMLSLNVRKNMDLVKAHGLTKTPTTLLFSHGSQTPVQTFEGLVKSDVLVAAIEELARRSELAHA